MAHQAGYRAYVVVLVAAAYFASESFGAKPIRQNQFRAIATRAGTDKLNAYEVLYEKYLQPIADDKLRLLEVGLGCDMNYGPGHSLQLWKEFLRNSELSFVEYDASCAEKFRDTIEREGRGRLYVGDQSNVTFLKSIVDDQAGKFFDVVIDDGGHHMEQQRTTLSHLWRLVAPGGFFVMEDLGTSYMPQYGGGPKGHPGTMIEMHKEMLDELHCKYQDCVAKLPGLLNMDCFQNACVMVKEGAAWYKEYKGPSTRSSGLHPDTTASPARQLTSLHVQKH